MSLFEEYGLTYQLTSHDGVFKVDGYTNDLDFWLTTILHPSQRLNIYYVSSVGLMNKICEKLVSKSGVFVRSFKEGEEFIFMLEVYCTSLPSYLHYFVLNHDVKHLHSSVLNHDSKTMEDLRT